MNKSKFNKSNHVNRKENLDNLIILEKKPVISNYVNNTNNKKPVTRSKRLANMRAKINSNSYPRLEMMFLVIFTGLSGFLSSHWLFEFNFTTMWSRYLISICISYASFILFLKMWLWYKTGAKIGDLGEFGDGADIVIPSGNSPPTHVHTDIPAGSFHGGGGSFDGGGASGDFGDAIGSVAEADEAAVPLIVIITLLFGLFSTIIFVFSLVNSAPILFSELLVDSVLSASLYTRLKGIDRRHWLESAIKRTFWPFFWVAVTFVVVGLVIQHYMPHIHSIGELITMIHHHR